MIPFLRRFASMGITALARLAQMVVFGVLLYMGLVTGMIAIGTRAVILMIYFATCVLLTWILSRTLKSRRGWAITGVLIVFLITASPCWVPDFPAQDFGPISSRWRWAAGVMRDIQRAEADFHAANHRYATLRELNTRHPLVADNRTFALDYLVDLTLTGDTYYLTATPKGKDNSYSCLLGCPTFKSLYAAPTGPIHIDCHCRPATATSPIAALDPR
jgi:4-amino-4-deoxy-L-arabinose transferase-like glycosyltransferase